MKIGFFVYHRIDGRGGLENALLTIIKALEKNNNEVFIFFWETTTYPEFLNNFQNVYVANPQGIKHVNHSLLPKFINRKLQKKHNFQQMHHFFKEQIDKLNLDILIIIDLPDTLEQFLPILEQYKNTHQIPLLTWIHGSIADSTPKQIKRTKKILPLFTNHLTVSNGISDELEELYQITNGIPVQNPIEEATIIPRGKNSFIYIGRIGDPRKQVNQLIEALIKLKGDWSLDIYGSTGSEIQDQQFLQKLEDLNLQGHINFHGWSDDPWSFIKKADILLLNSYTEGFGLVLVEAMMRGIPCISSDCPVGPREIIQPDVNGWLFDVGKEEQLIELLQSIIDGKRHLPNEKSIQETVLQYRSDIVTQNFQHILEKIIEIRK